MTKYKLFGGIAVAGVLCTSFGAWMKILHLSNANSFLTVGLFAEGIGLAALVWFIFEWLEKKNK
jgi:hypothetical protein